MPQPGLGGRRMYYTRGRGLGGPSSMNGMIYIRGNARDYDGWRQLGLEGWAYDDVLPYFKRAGDSARGDGEFHGGGGPLRTHPSANYNAIDRMFMDVESQAGLALNLDFNGESQIGRGVYDVTIRGGRRCSAEQAYLAPVHGRPNLPVITGAHATHLRIDEDRAQGVIYECCGQTVEARADREIILALGTFGTPRLMMLSGIGPGAELRRHGIAVIADLPDLQIFFTPMVMIEDPNGPFNQQQARSLFDLRALGRTFLVRGQHAISGYQVDSNLMGPESLGRLTLRSADPRDYPAIDPQFLRA
ncbi:MAG: GMC family oxidoreductase N-terminal domain-containing protein [Alphaproteobacteria bacterium]